MTMGDLNNDGALDIVVANQDKSDLAIFIGLGNINFSDPSLISM